MTGVEIAETVWWALRRCSTERADAIDVSVTPVEEPRDPIEPRSSLDPLPPPLDEPRAEIVPDRPAGKSPSGLPENYQPIRVEDPAAIADPLALARSLRPLLRQASFGEPRILDEEMTVDRIAETGIWQPVLRSARELMFDVALVYDTSPSMALWRRLNKDLCRLLSRYGQFRNLYHWKLVISDSGDSLGSETGKRNTTKIQLQSSSNGTFYPTSRLLTADRRRIVLVVSDCASPFWRDAPMQAVLHQWARSMPTAIVQVLPEHLWPQTTLGRGSAVQLRVQRYYDRQSIPSQALTAVAQSFLSRQRIATASETPALRLPIVALESQALSSWARLVAGDRRVRVPGVLWETHGGATQMEASRSTDRPRDRRRQSAQLDPLDIFLQTATPTARKLAALLAASPLVMLPIVRLIQRALLPRSRSSHVAEVFFSGLFVVASSERLTLDSADRAIYELADPDYRSRLLERVSAIDRLVVIERVSARVAASLGASSIDDFKAWLRRPRQAVEAGAGEQAEGFLTAFATVTADVLRGLGSEFDAFVRELEVGQAVQPDRASPEFEWDEVESEVAVFDRATWPEIAELEYEFVEAIAVLRQFEFETAEIAIKEVTTRRGMFGIGRKVDRQPVITRRRAANWGYTETLGDEIGLDMMSIPGGMFQMGSPEDELDRFSDESPQHEVTVQPFFMGRYAITQAQWRAVARYPQINRKLNPDPSRFKGDNRPVENVSWADAREFCQRLRTKTGKTYRLASEAEWEYACRAGTETPFHFGEMIDAEIANYNARTERENWKPVYGEGRKGEYRQQTIDVGSFPSNFWGLHDMHGNVWEWCEDDWHESYEGAPTDGSAWIEEKRTETRRLLRGGSWYGDPRHCRSAVRFRADRDGRSSLFGFRVVCASPSAL